MAMPFDPFFTAKAKDQFHEERQRSKACAKAIQLRIFRGKVSRAKGNKALAKHLLNPEERGIRHLKENSTLYPISDGHASLRGFKQPKKIWDDNNSGKT